MRITRVAHEVQFSIMISRVQRYYVCLRDMVLSFNSIVFFINIKINYELNKREQPKSKFYSIRVSVYTFDV